MKVIFIEDVPNVGRAGETKEVAGGYGRNFLLPRKLAVLANSQGSAVLESQLKKIALKRTQAEAEMAELAGKMDGMEVTLKAKTGAKDRLYGSITSADIADELSRHAGQVVDKRKIELEEPIRQLGSYEVAVRFTHEIAAVVKVTVVTDEAVEEKEEEKAEAKKGKKAKEEEGKKAEVKKGKKAEEEGEKKDEAKKGKKAKEKEEEKAEVKKGKKAKEKGGKKAEAKAEKEAEDKVEEAEDKVEEAEDKVEEIEEKEAEPGE